MIAELKLILEGIADALYGFLVLPGEVFLSALVLYLPSLAGGVGIDGEAGDQAELLVTSLVLWILFFVICWLILTICKDLVRVGLAVFHTLLHRASQGLGNLKTALVCKLRERVPERRLHRTVTTPTLEFDDLDLEILQSVSELGPGFTMSAPELAERITRRPAQIQSSLDKLFQTRMLDSVIGSTDGFDKYRLTDSGAQFIAMWQRGTANA